MYKILNFEHLNDTVCRIRIEAKHITNNCQPGQFVIIRVKNDSERIPLTISNYDRNAGWLEAIFQIVGASTIEMSNIKIGEFLQDIVGPLGIPTHTTDKKRVAVIGGGVGAAIALPVAKGFVEAGAKVDTIVGFRNNDLVILENEFNSIGSNHYLMSDDGSAGEKGLVTNKLEELVSQGNSYNEVFAVGPIIMMKFVAGLCGKLGLPITVSMNPIMVDGTGMCGACRLEVDGVTKFACVDGPDFDGSKIDYDLIMNRNTMYKEFEADARTKCASGTSSGPNTGASTGTSVGTSSNTTKEGK
jgi:ferredoxin--NADP+ reductase